MRLRQFLGIAGAIALSAAILQALAVLYGPTHPQPQVTTYGQFSSQDGAPSGTPSLPVSVFDPTEGCLLGTLDLTITVDGSGHYRVVRDGVSVSDPSEKAEVIERAGAEILQVREFEAALAPAHCAASVHRDEPHAPCPLCSNG